ncbi:MAG: phosphate acetyltransferase [Bacillota bacterium]|nr:phosphate acetyltransferase [Bacillota bacterium]
MSFMSGIMDRARADRQRIVLPETDDIRVLEAASRALADGLADIILVGNPARIRSRAGDWDLSGATFIDPADCPERPAYEAELVELRKAKGMTPEKARVLLDEPIYFAVMLVHEGVADGMVAGAVYSTPDVLRPSLQILRTAPGTKLVSAYFIMTLPTPDFGVDGTLIYADSGLNENPNVEQLAEIAIASAKTLEMWTGVEARVAMLSYSTKGSAKSELTEKVIAAYELARQKAPDLKIDGELQVDAALVPAIAAKKAPGSPVEGKANVLIFPNLDSGNIAYKLTERLAGADAYGPLLQGIGKPVNDLSRGCSPDDILGVIAITAVQAQNA